MSGIKIANGTAASAEQTVDTNGNAHVVLPTDDSQAGFAALLAESDPGTLVSRTVIPLEATQDFRLRVSMDTPAFDLSFEGTIVAQALVSQTVTATMAAAQASGFLTLNSALSVSTSSAIVVQTYRRFPLFGSATTYAEFWAKPINETATNSATEFGFGYVSGVTVLPTDGVFFRYNAGGQLMGVINIAGTETTTNLTSPTTNQVHHYAIEVHNERVNFWINDVLYGTIATPTANPAPTNSCQQPLFARVYNTASVPSAARQLSIGKMTCSLGEFAAARPWGHTMCGMGGGAYQIQPGTASGPTLTRGAASTGWPTSATALAAGTYTATSAPATNSLGGFFLTPAISTLTTAVDYPVFSYLNPVGTATLPGKTLYITSVQLNLSARAAASTNISGQLWGVGVGSTSPNTTATEGAAVVAARIIPLAAPTWSATAAIGESRGPFNLDCSQAPLVCPAGTYVHLIFRHEGTVTSNTLVIAGSCTFIGYYE